MRRQHLDDDTQCRLDATRRVLVASGDPPDPEQSGFAGTIYMVLVCKEHDPRSPAVDAVASGSRFRPIGQRPRRQGTNRKPATPPRRPRLCRSESPRGRPRR